MSLSTYLAIKLLRAVLNSEPFEVKGSPFVSLHTGDPGKKGDNEVMGGRYKRQPAVFTLVEIETLANAENIEFIAMPSETFTHVGLWDAIIRGNFLWGGELVIPKTTNHGDTFRIMTGDLDIVMDQQ